MKESKLAFFINHDKKEAGPFWNRQQLIAYCLANLSTSNANAAIQGLAKEKLPLFLSDGIIIRRIYC